MGSFLYYSSFPRSTQTPNGCRDLQYVGCRSRVCSRRAVLTSVFLALARTAHSALLYNNSVPPVAKLKSKRARRVGKTLTKAKAQKQESRHQLIQSKPARSKAVSSKPQFLTSPDLKKISWLIHGFSTRPGGVSTAFGGHSLNLGFPKPGVAKSDKRSQNSRSSDSRVNVAQNRELLLRAVDATTGSKSHREYLWPLVTLRQVHSDVIHVVTSGEPGSLSGDGMITNVPGIVLGILTADCFPILLVDKKTRAVGAFHAGWGGTLQRIVEKGVGAMRREFGSRPQDIHAAIGPGIQKCCYEVGDEFPAKFEAQFAYAADLFHEIKDSYSVQMKYPMLFMNQRAPGHGDLCIKQHLDLQEGNRRQLLDAGVPARQITPLADCTACDTKKFFSHRAEHGHAGRMMAVIGIRK